MLAKKGDSCLFRKVRSWVMVRLISGLNWDFDGRLDSERKASCSNKKRVELLTVSLEERLITNCYIAIINRTNIDFSLKASRDSKREEICVKMEEHSHRG
ncbi:ENTH/VHS/GAT family protein [Striga asiatica]|uniref:ENTH/VHS/GAT family protein n=1 Tax=Striga asiatica TaxID=4170 RepID=A0A5A7NZH2_STRAF|nr:ENTH/VHS/GAT family protein [Striga asiatica]